VKRFCAVVLAAAAVTGCGSESRSPPKPRLPAAVAEQLARQSDRVAAALAAGDACKARDEARRLQQQTLAAINARRIPGPFQEQLGTTVNALADRIACTPSVPAVDEENERDSGHGKGHKDKKGKGHD
jgi:hypothetical protein